MSFNFATESAEPDVVKLETIRFGWPGQASELLNVGSLRLVRGERVFLHGPSGSGKSTLLSLVAGVLKPDSGSIQILGNTISSLGSSARDRFRADHVGIIFQQFNLIPYLSVIENVTLPCQFSEIRREKVIERSGNETREALRLLERLDMADSNLLDTTVTQLSVGQQQRVAVARALIGAPELLIADEPTSSMDADRRHAFIELLFEECQESGSALLFVSHDHGLQDPFDRAIRLDEFNSGINDDAVTLDRACGE